MIGRLYRLGRASSRARARELLAQFSLEEAADRPVKGYSGGMRRRLDLAGALIASPPVLFLDEPTTGLDPRSRTDMWEVIRELVRGGSTLLLTTQYLEEADLLADQIVVIDHGRAIAQGTADSLKSQVGGERVEVVVGPLADLELARGVLAAVATGSVQLDPHTRRLTAPVSGGGKVLVEALSRLDAAGIEVLDVSMRRPTLDDVFLSLTGRPPRNRAPSRPAAPRPLLREHPMSTLTDAMSDGAVVAKRNLIKIRRIPELLVFTTLQPIMFILLFAYIFGSAIDTGAVGYREFLVAGSSPRR
jgi:ABC-2 type transport system ATP-binding protein